MEQKLTKGEIIFQSSLIAVARFRCRPDNPRWFTQNVVPAGPILVFPRIPVMITYAGHEPIVADPSRVMMYNHHQVYSRKALNERGDECEYFCFNEALLRELVNEYDEAVEDRGSQVLKQTNTFCNSETYLLQRLIVNALCDGEVIDSLLLDEILIHLAQRVIGSAYQQENSNRKLKAIKTSTKRVHRDLCEDVRILIGNRFSESLQLEDIARELHTTPYHLCRLFRSHTGGSIHQYRNLIRLRQSLEPLAEGDKDLSRLALSLGYTSHSHFTSSFKREFSITPSIFRNHATVKELAGCKNSLRQALFHQQSSSLPGAA